MMIGPMVVTVLHVVRTCTTVSVAGCTPCMAMYVWWRTNCENWWLCQSRQLLGGPSVALALQKESAVIAFDGHLGRLSQHCAIFVKFLINIFIMLPASFLPHCMKCTHGLAMRILSVCPSVCQTHALWQNGRKICPDFYTIPCTYFGLTGPHWSEIANFLSIFARSASVVTPTKKV